GCYRIDQKGLGLIDAAVVVGAFGVIIEAPILALLTDPHEPAAGQLNVQVVRRFALRQSGGFEHEATVALDRPEQRKAGRAGRPLGAANFSVSEGDLGRQRNTVAADEVGAVQADFARRATVLNDSKAKHSVDCQTSPPASHTLATRE